MAQTTIQGSFLGDATVTGAKIGADFISAQTALTTGLATTDEIIVSDAGVIKRMDISVLEIAATQITASGTLPALNGSNLTALNGSQITTGTVADARISALTASKLTGALPAISGANLTNLPASGATLSGSTNNTIVTVTGADAMIGEAKLTYDGDGMLTMSNSSGSNNWLNHATATSGTANPSRLILRTADGNAADTYISFHGVNTYEYSIGVDNSDSDKFKISGSALGTNDKLIIESSGNATFTGNVTVGNSSATSGSDTAQQTTLYGNISCLAYANANQSMANAAVVTINLQSNAWDSDNMDDSGTGITIRKAGVYLIKGAMHYAANSSGARYLSIYTNGTVHDVTQDELPPHGSNYTAIVMGIQELAVNDVVYLKCRQTSGSSLNSLVQGRNFPHLTVVRLC